MGFKITEHIENHDTDVEDVNALGTAATVEAAIATIEKHAGLKSPTKFKGLSDDGSEFIECVFPKNAELASGHLGLEVRFEIHEIE